MKKLLTVVLVAALVSSLGGSTVLAESNSPLSPVEDTLLSSDKLNDLNDKSSSNVLDLSAVESCFSMAKDILKNYYERIDIGTEQSVKGTFTDDTKLLAHNLSEYVEKKMNTKHFVVEAANAQKENYVLTFNLLSSEVTKEGILLTISTEASFNYVGMEVQSGFGEVSNVLFTYTDAGLTMSDWYMPDDYYDEFVRGSLDHSSNLTMNSISESSNIAEKQTELEKKITDYFSVNREFPVEMTSTDGVEATNQVITPLATLASLNKTAIANYAKNNKAKDSPASGGSNVSYYDFSQISGNWDCTNFVSHALLAGGAIPYDTNGSGISSKGWYYRSLSNRSSSWSGVPNLHDFLVNNTTKGPAGSATTYSTFKYNPNAGYPYAIGDILQFYLSGSYNNWRHSTIITEYYETNTALVLGALVTGRTGKGAYNNNQKAEEIYPGDSKRVIKLSGYYK